MSPSDNRLKRVNDLFERTREEMHQMASEHSLTSAEMIKISRRLDKLHNLYEAAKVENRLLQQSAESDT